MLSGVLILLGCQLAGELIVVALGLPVPGPVVGMLLLVAGLLLWRRQVPEALPAGGGNPAQPSGTAVCARGCGVDGAF